MTGAAVVVLTLEIMVGFSLETMVGFLVETMVDLVLKVVEVDGEVVLETGGEVVVTVLGRVEDMVVLMLAAGLRQDVLAAEASWRASTGVPVLPSDAIS